MCLAQNTLGMDIDDEEEPRTDEEEGLPGWSDYYCCGVNIPEEEVVDGCCPRCGELLWDSEEED